MTERRQSSETQTELLSKIQIDVSSLQQDMVERKELEERLTLIHADHHKYIETLIKKEEQRIAFRQAVIEKTVSSLLWSGLTGIGFLLWQSLKVYIK
jgi:hypothetical protein